MATSESDDFESADEELDHGAPGKRAAKTQHWSSPATIGSDSDDDTEYVPRVPCRSSAFDEKSERFRSAGAAAGEKAPAASKDDGSAVSKPNMRRRDEREGDNNKDSGASGDRVEMSVENAEAAGERGQMEASPDDTDMSKEGIKCSKSKRPFGERERVSHRKKPESSRQSGVKKLGTKIPKGDVISSVTAEGTSDSGGMSTECLSEKLGAGAASCEDKAAKHFEDEDLSVFCRSGNMDELTEMDMPEELKSNKKFKEIFKPEGWEGLGDDIELPEELTEEKLQPVLERLSLAGHNKDTSENASGGWGGWGSWGVSSLINTATAGVSTLTSHVTHGLTILEETIGVPDPGLPKIKEYEDSSPDEKESETTVDTQSLGSFGLGNLISGVSSITKLVESTGTKVVAGGLDTLEAIGKKTMEVLQEGDPGLKKKRAFFINEADKPILSQVLREAKEKAEAEEKTLEEKQRARRIHFESLFDDYQGLVHLEALEMLSKQSNMKIQQYLAGLDTDELTSIQETLAEVQELCDLDGDEEEEEEEEGDKKVLKTKLADICNDLGISITYEKLDSICEKTNSYLASSMAHTDHEIFECAVSTLAQFTAFSVERFHKTAELLLVKERRSTVNEADALVQLTRILSNEIGTLANSFCNRLNELVKTSDKPDGISANITTIFMEATNASSYIQDAFRLLIPILQVGAI